MIILGSPVPPHHLSHAPRPCVPPWEKQAFPHLAWSLQGQVWLKRRPPSQPGTKRNLQYLEGLQAFYTSSCNPSGLCFLASPLTAHRRLAEPASPCTVRLALLEVPWKHGEWCLLTVEVRQAWLRMDGPFRSPVGGALVREALLMRSEERR